VGRIAEVKNQKLLVAGIKCLLNSRPALQDSLRVVLVGDGPLYNMLKAYVAELGLSDLIWMAGDREDISELMQLMDIFVLPSLAEGISNTVLEAMATGLPVIATNVGGNPELISEGENGRLVTVGDEQMLATVVGDLIDSPEARKRMGQKGLSKVKATFNWQKTVGEYLGVYDELLGNSQVPGETNSN
jgi:glycosyltransferase involved in cell wall biosynthesis